MVLLSGLLLLRRPALPLTEPKVAPSRMLLVGASSLLRLNPLMNFRRVPENYKVAIFITEGQVLVDATMEESMALELALRTFV